MYLRLIIRHALLVLFVLFLPGQTEAQKYTTSHIFAHNDYVREVPFYTAYNLGVGFIEADVFLHNDSLMVAHHRNEIENDRHIEILYLQPLLKEIRRNNGLAYSSPDKRLTLMVDLKTEGAPTLKAFASVLARYPELTSCKTLQFLISGDVPDPKTWDEYPGYIRFDGRPGILYTTHQLDRISMISTNFRSHVDWDGQKKMSADDERKIGMLIGDAHRKGKTFRFWATPDFPDAWDQLMALHMDVIVTDDVTGLAEFLKTTR